MKITGFYTSIAFDADAASRHVKRRMREILISGIKAWVEEAKSNIPVWSGASRGALTQVASYVGIPIFGPGKGSRVAHSNTPVSTAPDRTIDGQQSESFEVEANPSGGKVSFRWRSDLFHLNVNERVNVNSLSSRFHLIEPGPYNLRVKADAAFREVVRKELARFRLPVGRFAKVTTRKLGG